MDKRTVDVAVIGNGVAGSTVAIRLSKLGFSVVLIGLPLFNKKFFGETLSPDIKSSLIHLGEWENFLRDEHLPSAGNISAWGDSEIKEDNFIFHPDTYGWHIDRLKFDSMLINAAKKAGAYYLESKIDNIDNNNYGGIWNLKLRTFKKIRSIFVTANLLVDATGRTSWLSLRKGIRRLTFDNLCGYVCFHRPRITGDSDSRTLIESVPDGWWYSALIPNNIRVTSFFTNSNLPIAQYAKLRTGWKKIMHKTKYIRLNIEKYNYCFISGPHAMISNSSILERVTGQNWLAVGDASVTYDPISSNGILSAINNGIICTNMIAIHLSKKNSSFEDYYSKKITEDYCSYLTKRNYYYNLERRWTDNAFWKQNQKLKTILID
jgi:flavin-dependent dehydrogenase